MKLKYNYYVIIPGYALGLYSLPLKPKHGAIYMSSFLVCQVQHKQESLRVQNNHQYSYALCSSLPTEHNITAGFKFSTNSTICMFKICKAKF
jgi:hypothetical protein